MPAGVWSIAKDSFADLRGECSTLSWSNRRTKNAGVTLIIVIVTMLVSKHIVVIPLLLQMLIYTLPVIWLGSHLALNLRVQTGGDKEGQGAETLGSSDALLFPIYASCSILGIYLIYKYLPEYWVNFVFNIFVCVVGIFSVGNTAANCWRIVTPQVNRDVDMSPRTIKMPWIICWITESKVDYIQIGGPEAFGFIVGCTITLGWLATKAWMLHNLFAIAFCIQAIRKLSVGTFQIATMLLGGLFFYDIFWVFKTDVMVTVAQRFQGPVKLLFPMGSSKYSLLGLGDIVVPGLFIAMALRFDYFKWSNAKVKNDDAVVSKEPPMFWKFSRFYFNTCMVAYAASLLVTAAVMLVWKAAQPALLYLVPGLFAALYIPALFKGDLGILMSYSEETEEEEDEDVVDDDQDDDTTQTDTTTNARRRNA